MLLRNYWVAFMGQMSDNPNGITITDYNGTKRTAKRSMNYNYSYRLLYALTFSNLNFVFTSVGGNIAGVVFGDGSTVNADDYKLSGSVITGISATATEYDEGSEESCIRRCIYTITNNNDSAITISEIGYYDFFLYAPTALSNALFEHTVLDNPITIEPGGVGQVTYEIKMNYPT